MLRTIDKVGRVGATFADLGIAKGSRTLPDLIFAGHVEYVAGSEPWRYRRKH